MKRITVLTLLVILSLSTVALGRSSVGSSFGTTTTAKALGQGRGDMTFATGIADGTSFTGTFTYGLSKFTTGRIKLGLTDPDFSDTKITIGADVTWQFWNYIPNKGKKGEAKAGEPFDFAIGSFIEFADFDYASVFQIGGQLLGSIPIHMSGGTTLSPYGKFNIRMESKSFNTAFRSSNMKDSQTELEVGFTAGVAWQATSNMALMGEFQFDGNDGLFIGVNFNIM